MAFFYINYLSRQGIRFYPISSNARFTRYPAFRAGRYSIKNLSHGTDFVAIGAVDGIRTRDTLLGRNNPILTHF